MRPWEPGRPRPADPKLYPGDSHHPLRARRPLVAHRVRFGRSRFCTGGAGVNSAALSEKQMVQSTKGCGGRHGRHPPRSLICTVKVRRRAPRPATAPVGPDPSRRGTRQRSARDGHVRVYRLAPPRKALLQLGGSGRSSSLGSAVRTVIPRVWLRRYSRMVRAIPVTTSPASAKMGTVRSNQARHTAKISEKTPSVP